MTAPNQPPTATGVRGAAARTARYLDPHGTAELAGQILRGVPRLPGALCRDNPYLFDPLDQSDPNRPGVEAEALSICQRCRVLPECQRWVDSLPPKERCGGIVAGRIDDRS
jgi:hypothetical protein